MSSKRRPSAVQSTSAASSRPIQLVDDVVEKLSVTRGRLWTARNKISAFNSQLMSTRSALLDAKLKYLKLRQAADDKSRELQELEKKAQSSEATLKNYEALINEFPSVCEELEESFASGASAREQQEMLQNFVRQSHIAPWSVEKRQHLHCLQEDENRLEITKRQIAAMEQKIEEKKQQVEQHREYSFQKFCFTLASFSRNQRSLRQLLKNEEAINRDLRTRAATMTSSEEFGVIDEIQFGNTIQMGIMEKTAALPVRAPSDICNTSDWFIQPRNDRRTSASLERENAWQGAVETSGKSCDRDSLTSLTSSAKYTRNENDIEDDFVTNDENNETELEEDNEDVVCLEITKSMTEGKKSLPAQCKKSAFFNFFDNFDPALSYSSETNPFGF